MSLAVPTGFQLAFLLFALHFAAMLAARPIAAALQLPQEHFNTLGLLLVTPLELTLILGLPQTRKLVRDQLARAPDALGRAESLAGAAAKLLLTFGIWGAMFSGLGFLVDREAMDRRYFSGWGLTFAVLAVSIGPLMEEIAFRGVLFRLWEGQWGWGIGMLLTSVAFAAVHPSNLIQTFLSSIIYVCLLRRTGSLWAPIVCHATYNLLVAWPLFGQVLMVRPPQDIGGVETSWFTFLCLAFAAIALPAYVCLAARRPAPNR